MTDWADRAGGQAMRSILPPMPGGLGARGGGGSASSNWAACCLAASWDALSMAMSSDAAEPPADCVAELRPPADMGSMGLSILPADGEGKGHRPRAGFYI